MKKNLLIFIVFSIVLSLSQVNVHASEGTAYTYTVSVGGAWIPTQDAYLPGQVLFHGGELSKPSDLFILGELIYISDAGNHQVVVYNKRTGTVETFGDKDLKEPRGIFVTADGTCYVADYGAESVVVFSKDRAVQMSIGRPESYLFSSQSRYKPTGVAVATSGIIYVTGEGSYEGVMQFNETGEFQGYFAANSTGMNLLERIQEMIFTDEQLSRLLTRKPRSIQAIDINERDLLFSVTQDESAAFDRSSNDNNVKLHNYAGVDILRKRKNMVQEWNFVDIAAGSYGNSYALTYTGLINEYDSSGNLTFSFGGNALSAERVGLFTMAAAIDTDEDGLLYVLDSEQALIQVFYPTEFAQTTHQGMQELSNGNYAGSEQIWADLLKLNGMSLTFHDGYGKSLYYQQRYEEAMDQYRFAKDRELYSESFWEIRDVFINRYIGAVLIILVVLWLVVKLIKMLFARRRGEEKPKTPGERPRLVQDLTFFISMFRHPIDGFYDIKIKKRGSVASASIIYAAALLVFMVDHIFRGFIFNYIDVTDAEPITVALTFLIPAMLWVVGNYFISSINDGEGSFRSVFIGMAYGLAPYVCITPFIVLLTYVLTKNEMFVISFTSTFSLCWSGALIFVGITEIHGYNFKNAVKNVLLTLFFMLMTAVVFVVLYLIWREAGKFAGQFFGEVLYRVIG